MKFSMAIIAFTTVSAWGNQGLGRFKNPKIDQKSNIFFRYNWKRFRMEA